MQKGERTCVSQIIVPIGYIYNTKLYQYIIYVVVLNGLLHLLKTFITYIIITNSMYGIIAVLFFTWLYRLFIILKA